MYQGVALPYGISDFGRVRRQGYAYVDKTPYLSALEDPQRGRSFSVFLRPRRTGKSLLLSMLGHYYDRLHAPHFDALFAGLAVAQAPTPGRSQYLILRLEFTQIATNRGVEQIRKDFTENLLTTLRGFIDRYEGLLPQLAAVRADLEQDLEPAVLVKRLLYPIAASGERLYVVIDEYDNFTNDLIARGEHQVYRDILHASGFVREFYKALKEGTAIGAVERIFMTGVSPGTLDDLTSGFNITRNLSLDPDFAALCGFDEAEVAGLLDQVLRSGPYTLDRDRVMRDLRRYYDGYCFARRSPNGLYNPDMVLYFLSGLRPPDQYPEEILDTNVRTDYGRLRRLMVTPEGAARPLAVESVEEILAERTIAATPHETFSLDLAYAEEYFHSLLYYMGMLTLRQEEQTGRICMTVPNYVVRTLYWELLSGLLKDVAQVQVRQVQLTAAVQAMAYGGDLLPFLTLVCRGVLARLSNRDLIRLSEKTVKAVLLSYLVLVPLFEVWSEMEMNGGYGDLVLLPARSQPGVRHGYVMELKYARAGTEAERVGALLDEADGQLGRYLSDERVRERAQSLQAMSLVFVGTQGCHLRRLGEREVLFIPATAPAPEA